MHEVCRSRCDKFQRVKRRTAATAGGTHTDHPHRSLGPYLQPERARTSPLAVGAMDRPLVAGSATSAAGAVVTLADSPARDRVTRDRPGFGRSRSNATSAGASRPTRGSQPRLYQDRLEHPVAHRVLPLVRAAARLMNTGNRAPSLAALVGSGVTVVPARPARSSLASASAPMTAVP
jgi:hypothetical protein